MGERPPVLDNLYIVLLACGHWIQVELPEEGLWPCPDGDGDQVAARASDGRAQIFCCWEEWTRGEGCAWIGSGVNG